MFTSKCLLFVDKTEVGPSAPVPPYALVPQVPLAPPEPPVRRKWRVGAGFSLGGHCLGRGPVACHKHKRFGACGEVRRASTRR